jgi:Insect cuticle protein
VVKLLPMKCDELLISCFFFRQILALFGLACTCFAQKQNTTPVPILKQINRHNEDGSYSYGYEAADGSFKIETKTAGGEVKGKYGYVDDSGNLREIEYGANHNGFQPTGDGINVAPAAQHNQQSTYPALGAGEIDDGQYREDPLMYNDPRYDSKPSKASQFRVNASPAPARPAYQPSQSAQPFRAPQPAVRAPAPQQNYYEEPVTERAYFQSRFQAPAQNYYQQPQQQAQPNYYRPQQSYSNYQHPDQVNIFQGHPASNLDLSTGSYTVTYG